MGVIRLAGFAGENRALHPKLLQDTVGTVSRNQRPGRGDLRPWKAPGSAVATVPSGSQTIYRMGRTTASDTLHWLSWNTRVRAVWGFDAEDTTERTYYTGNGTPKVTDNIMGLASTPYPTASRPLGLPAPATPPVIVASPFVPTTENVVRQATTFQAKGGVAVVTTSVPHTMEGGETATLALSNGFSGSKTILGVVSSTALMFAADDEEEVPVEDVTGTVTVSRTEEPPPDETYFYVYTYVNDWGWESAPSPPSVEHVRTQGSNATISAFASAPAGNYNINRIRIYRTQTGASGATEFFFLREISYGTSSTLDDNRELGEVLPTTTWLPAPDDLSFLTPLWNGMLAGISGNSVRFCEAYVPYAWPIAYDVVPPDSRPVALGVFGQTLLVLTTGRPLLVAGSGPEAMDQQLMEIPQACVAPESVVSMGSGVAWASQDGLCWFGAGGAKILTSGLMTREDWQALVPTSIVGKFYEGLYFGSYDDGSGRKGFIIDPANPSGIYFLDTGYATLHFDELQDQLYVLDDTAVRKWDAGAPMTYRFRSKEFRSPRPTIMACAEVLASAYPVTFRLYADGTLRHTQTVVGRDPFRLPAGYTALDWQIEVEGSSPVQAVAVASSITEIAQS